MGSNTSLMVSCLKHLRLWSPLAQRLLSLSLSLSLSQWDGSFEHPQHSVGWDIKVTTFNYSLLWFRGKTIQDSTKQTPPPHPPQILAWQTTQYFSTHFQTFFCLLVSSVENCLKHPGPRSGPTKVRTDLDPTCLALWWFPCQNFQRSRFWGKNR